MASMRHNRKRKRGRRRFGLLFKLLCGAALVAAATLGATVFFQVETIAVVGNSRYTAQEVIDASGVQIGDNLFQMNKNQISQQILQRLPYVGEVSPQRGLPSTLTIQVTEISAAAQQGTRELMYAAARELEHLPPITVYEPTYVERPPEVDMSEPLEITHEDDTWLVEGPWLQRLMANVNFGDYESRNWFDRMLRESGLFDRLEAMGIQDGDTVSLYNLEFEYRR